MMIESSAVILLFFYHIIPLASSNSSNVIDWDGRKGKEKTMCCASASALSHIRGQGSCGSLPSPKKEKEETDKSP